MKHNLRSHEFIGLLLIFSGGTLFGIGMYIIFWAAIRALYYDSLNYLLSGKELLVFPILFGSAAVLWVLGQIELKEVLPGKKRL